MPKFPKYQECTLWFCHERHYGRGLCANHYQNYLRGRSPLPSGATDLAVVLRKVDEMRDGLAALIGTEQALTRIRVSGQLVGLRCNYCNAEITVEDGVETFPLELHAAGCPIATAQKLLDETVSNPPNDYYSYPLSWQTAKAKPVSPPIDVFPIPVGD